MNPLRIPAAYFGLIVLWSTTPLAVKWSGEGPGYLFGVTSRMCLGLASVLLVLIASRQPLPWHRTAWLAYLVGAVQLYGSMLAMYWASPFIPSGWISVISGLTPLITALLAAAWLGERSLTPGRLLSYVLGIAGLGVMFGSAWEFGSEAALGVGGMLLAVGLQALSSVGLKRLNPGLPALTQVTGSLLLSVPAYLATWTWADGQWPVVLPLPSLLSILYLGVIATPLGFALYFFVLRHLPATRVALVTLMTPVFSLWIGYAANGEPVSWRVAQGTALILGALLLHDFTGGSPKAAAALGARFFKNRGRNSPDSVP